MKTLSCFTSIVVMVGVSFVAACSSSTNNTNTAAGAAGSIASGNAGGSNTNGAGAGGNNAGGDSAGGNNAGGDSAGGNNAGGDSAGGNGDATAGPNGIVILSEADSTLVKTYAQNYSASALFTMTQTMSSEKCTMSMFSTCMVVVCDTSDAGGAGGMNGAGGAAAVKYSSAGDITISGGVEPITLTVDATQGRYKFVHNDKKLAFQGGETLTFTAAGAEVPMFSGSLVAPKSPVVSAPVLTPGSMIDIDRSHDLAVAWSGANVGSVRVSLIVDSNSVFCTFDASANTGTVPTAALSKLSTGSGAFLIESVSTKRVTAGAYTILLEAQVNSKNPDGTATVDLVNVK